MAYFNDNIPIDNESNTIIEIFNTKHITQIKSKIPLEEKEYTPYIPYYHIILLSLAWVVWISLGQFVCTNDNPVNLAIA